MFLVFLNIVSAIDKVFAVDFIYADGRYIAYSLNIFDGKAPDRNYQPDDGYKAEVISFDKKILYTFRFNFKEKIYVDNLLDQFISGEKSNQTNIQKSSNITLETRFQTLIIPYYANAYKIRFYNPTGVLIEEVLVEKKITKEEPGLITKPKEKAEIWPIILKVLITISIIMILIILMLILKKRPQNR